MNTTKLYNKQYDTGQTVTSTDPNARSFTLNSRPRFDEWGGQIKIVNNKKVLNIARGSDQGKRSVRVKYDSGFELAYSTSN